MKLEDRPALSIQDLSQSASRVIENVERVIVGKQESVRLTLIAVLCGGHVLIEDVPGVGKTTLMKSIARSIGCGLSASSSRLTCCPAMSLASPSSTSAPPSSSSGPARS